MIHKNERDVLKFPDK